MKHVPFYALIGIISVASVFAASSHPVARSPGSKFNPLKQPLPLVAALAQKGILAKQAAAAARLSKINIYSYEDLAWTLDGPIFFKYDNRGRLVEITDGAQSEDSSIIRQTFEYYDASFQIRSISYSKDSSSFFSYESYEIVDYYYNEQQAFNSVFVPGDPLSLFELSTPQMRGIDSVTTLYLSRDLETTAWDTSNNSKTTYSYASGSVTAITRSRIAVLPVSDPAYVEYVYRLDASGRIDSVLISSMNEAGAKVVDMHMTYTYDTGNRPVLLSIKSTAESVYGFFEEEMHITYLASGLTGSYLVKMRETASGAMENVGKMEFVYESIGVLPFREKNRHSAVTLTERAGTWLISGSADCAIYEVVFFDLNGRMVTTYQFAGRATGEAVALPLASRGNGVSLLRVRTSRGVYHFALNGPAGGRIRD